MIDLWQNAAIANKVIDTQEEMANAKKLASQRAVKLKTRIRKNMNLVYTYEGKIKARNDKIRALLDEVAQIKAKRELAKMEIREDEGKLAA